MSRLEEWLYDRGVIQPRALVVLIILLFLLGSLFLVFGNSQNKTIARLEAERDSLKAVVAGKPLGVEPPNENTLDRWAYIHRYYAEVERQQRRAIDSATASLEWILLSPKNRQQLLRQLEKEWPPDTLKHRPEKR